MRAALKFAVSTVTRSSEKSASSVARQPFTRARAASSFGRSMRYNKWAPLPESAWTGSGRPSPAIHRATSSAFARASPCSSSVLDTPLGRSGSISTGSQRRCWISASLVVLSFLPRRILIRFARRESRAGFTSFSVM
ncbi:MAG: hypothetical protein A4E35_01894 [Methanoregula sp. PtaU1.Bin051]|nr:MAG: hypothetical protein A4E35_01894 [Methanoregula sp. PtaU1.Bin051]